MSSKVVELQQAESQRLNKLKSGKGRRSLKVSESVDGKRWATNSEKSTGQLPKWVMLSHAFRQLSHPAKTVLLAMLYQHWGDNNGCIEITMSIMREFGIGSDHTLQAVRDELLESGLIYKTVESQFLNPGGRPALYALAWMQIPDGIKPRKHGITPCPAMLLKPSVVAANKLKADIKRKGK